MREYNLNNQNNIYSLNNGINISDELDNSTLVFKMWSLEPIIEVILWLPQLDAEMYHGMVESLSGEQGKADEKIMEQYGDWTY